LNEHTIAVGEKEPAESSARPPVEAAPDKTASTPEAVAGESSASVAAPSASAKPTPAKPSKPAKQAHKGPRKNQAAMSKPSAPAAAAKTVAKTAPKSKATPPKKALVKRPEPPKPVTLPKAAAGAKRNERADAAAALVEKDAAKPKAKLVRDSFTMPQRDFSLIAALKDRALDFKRPTKKSELLRAGLHALSAMKQTDLKQALEQLAPIKAGRPKNPT